MDSQSTDDRRRGSVRPPEPATWVRILALLHLSLKTFQKCCNFSNYKTSSQLQIPLLDLALAPSQDLLRGGVRGAAEDKEGPGSFPAASGEQHPSTASSSY